MTRGPLCSCREKHVVLPHLQVATADLTRLDNMVRFITSVISGSLKISNRKRAEVLAELQAQGYDKLGGKKVCLWVRRQGFADMSWE